jgi:hypothetical protein
VADDEEVRKAGLHALGQNIQDEILILQEHLENENERQCQLEPIHIPAPGSGT